LMKVPMVSSRSPSQDVAERLNKSLRVSGWWAPLYSLAASIAVDREPHQPSTHWLKPRGQVGQGSEGQRHEPAGEHGEGHLGRVVRHDLTRRRDR